MTAAAVLVCVVLGALGAFQVALALGAPWGRLAWGGTHEVLPTRLRVGSAVSVLGYLLMALVVLDKAGLVDVVPDGFSRVGAWVLAAYFLVGVGMNLASRSVSERAVMTPVAALLCAGCTVVALG